MARSAHTFDSSQVPVGQFETHEAPLFLSVALGATQTLVDLKHSVGSQEALQESFVRDVLTLV